MENYLADTRILQIGKRSIKDYSDIIQHFDSLATEQVRHGADSYSNVSGSPWPLEIIRPRRGNRADLKYRLDMGGFFVYSDEVPTLKWEFATDSIAAILGYECQKAIVEYAGRTYSAWFTAEIPLPFGPWKFGGLPGLILKIEDAEQQFVWEAVGFERSKEPIMEYTYRDGNDKHCTASEVAKVLMRYFHSPVGFLIASMGGDSRRVHIVGKDGNEVDTAEAAKQSIPYKPLEIK